MQTRRELYELIGYHDYEALDESIARSIAPRRAPRRPPPGAWRSIKSGSTRRPRACRGKPSSPGSSPPSPCRRPPRASTPTSPTWSPAASSTTRPWPWPPSTGAPVAAARAMALAHPRAGGATLFGLPGDDRRPRGVGGVGERHGGPRARLPRHLPGRRLRASRRQHPAAHRRRPAEGRGRRAAPRRHRGRLRDPCGLVKASACTRRRRTMSPTWRPRSRPGSARCSACETASVYHAAQPGRAPRLRDAPVAEGPDHVLEGLGAGLGREARHRGRGPRDARRGRAEPHLRGRGRRDRLDAGRPGRRVRGAPPRPRRAAARDPRDLPEGALGRVPGPGADRPRVRAPAPAAARGPRARRARSSSTRATTRTPSSAPARTIPRSTTRTPRRETLDHSIMYILAVALEDGRWHHVRLLPARARAPPVHHRPLAQDPDGRGPGLDGALPRSRSGAEGVRRPRRPDAGRRQPS